MLRRLLLILFLFSTHSAIAQTGYYHAVSPDFSFLTGSCAFLDTTQFDSTGNVYKNDTVIFNSMAKKQADFMIWLGDNWYLGKDEWNSLEGLRHKAHVARTAAVMRRLVNRKIPEYAIWDDHDFGPDQSNQDFPLKKESRKVFMETWKDNPYYGENNEGIYTSFKKDNVLFILLDDRWWRDFDNLWDYKWFKINPNKKMFGHQQMEWLKKKLMSDSTSDFKIIINGSQMLNPWAREDCFVHYPTEYRDLLDFIKSHNINGVIFLSGDRHFSEIIKLNRKDHYPLYDITVSPFTSDVAPVRGREKKNKFRVNGTLIEKQNFARFIISNLRNERKLRVEFFDKYGKNLKSWEVMSKDLKNKKVAQ